jgi:hypothetical protein
VHLTTGIASATDGRNMEEGQGTPPPVDRQQSFVSCQPRRGPKSRMAKLGTAGSCYTRWLPVHIGRRPMPRPSQPRSSVLTAEFERSLVANR